MRNFADHGVAAVCGLLLAAFTGASVTADDPKLSGQIEVEQVQIAFIGSGNLGGGTLHFQGKDYSFTIGGLGIGGFGVSKIEATGEVYDLERLADFPGAYAEARYGAVIGDKSTGELWLRNPNGVSIHLMAKRKGLALSLGGDAIYINLD